jgi:hypothetical protein
MAIRRPSIYSPTWIFQDFLYLDGSPEQLRYLLVKWDGAVYSKVSQTFDYSNPPYSDAEQRGGNIVARIDYTLNDKLITIDSWEVNWRDEWPLRIAVNYLANCLYNPKKNYVVRVEKTIVDQAFWQSEFFTPTDNLYNYYELDPIVQNSPPSFLVFNSGESGSSPSSLPESYSVTMSPNPANPGATLYVTIETENVPTDTPVYWRLSGPGVNPTFFTDGRMSGVVSIGR